MKSPRVIAFLLTLVLSVTLCGADKRPITPQDLWAMKRLGSPALSPDGQTAVFTVQEWSIEKNKSTTNLWLVDTAGGAPRRRTSAPVSDNAPAWSPDGTRLAFTSKRGEDETASLYVMRVDGGEPEKILELPYAVSAPQWLPDSQSVIVAITVIPELAGTLAPENLAAMKKEIKRRKDSKMTAKVTEDRQYRFFDHWLTDNLASRLLRVNVTSKEIKDLTPKWDRLFQTSGDVNFDLSPDGTQVALGVNVTPPPYAGFLNVDIMLVPTDGSGAMKNLTAENQGDDDGPKFTPDGQAVVFTRQETPYYNGEFGKLWRHDLATARNTPLTEALDYAISGVEFSADGRTMWFAAEDKGVVPVFKLNADGTGLTPVYRQGTSSRVTAAGDTVVFLNDTSSRPNELFALEPATGAVRQLTHINDDLVAQLDLGQVESYWFDGAAGAKVQGWLVLPPGYDPKKTYPLLQLMHGGPHTMVSDSWSYRWNIHVFAAPGYITTWVNRHGSTGFGEKYCQSILNQWGDMPLEDILKATDHLLQRFPNIDPKRMAAAGGSYGGYMAAWVAGHTDRFAALINHAGVNDFITQYGADVTQYGFSQVLGGTPWSNPEGMQKNNPTTYAKNFKTPMLIIHGELDYRVPYVNGTALYAIYQAMNVPSRLVIFPNENHWVLSPQNAIYWHWEMQSWLARYIGGQPALAKPVFDSESK
ncbi:MAG: S9 family peptidase [Lacunisphaera sp.]|nr:S9 family peptidase [Lacunisphaera sp.]